MKRMLIPALALSLGAVALAGCSSPANPGSADTTGITTSATGTATATPDIVTVTLGVTTRAANASAALDENNTRANDLINSLKERGIAAEDLQTSGLSINPTYGENFDTITGYEVSNQVRATLRDISRAGELIDAAARAAGDAIRVQSLAFSISEESEAMGQARADAVRNARTQADQMAEAAGVSVGDVRAISDVSVSTPGPMFSRQESFAADSAVPIEPGTQELTVTVSVAFDINR